MNLSVQTCWKDKFQGRQNIKCIPLWHTSRFPPFMLVAEKCCETRFGAHGTLYFTCYKRLTFFPFYIIIKTILLRKCFEYAQAITGDWIYFEVVWIVNHRNKFLTRLPSCIIFVIFLDIRLEACSFTKNKPLIRYFLSILTTVSPGNFKSCYF